MAGHAIIFDCETLTHEASPRRFWCGPDDPDPLLAQIGAVRLSLAAPFELGARFSCLIRPVGRDGPVAVPPFFTRLTGITAQEVEQDGYSLEAGLGAFAAFAGSDPIYSWGKDEITAIAPSCFAANVVSPLPASRFRNAAALVRAAGEPLETVHGLRSHTIAAHFGLPPEAQAHDGVADAVSVARVLQHLMAEGRLDPGAFWA